MTNDYWTMKEIGTLFGVSSHKIGKTLKELGLRTPENKPSKKAFDLGLVKQRWAEDMPVYLWAWHRDKIAALLEQAGMERVKDAEPN